MKFDQGYISRYFATDNKTQKCEMDNPYILLADKKISNIHELIPLLESVSQARAKLVIIAENVDGEVAPFVSSSCFTCLSLRCAK
jgi:chaperonin GroEL